jgi:predicted kinase
MIQFKTEHGPVQVTGPVCTILVGLPGAGKSTGRDAYTDVDTVILSTDDYVESLALQDGSTYNDKWQDNIDDATKEMNMAFLVAIKERRSIVVDRTNLTPKSRRKFLSQLPKEYTKVAVYHEIDEDVRQERMRGRVGKTIPSFADDDMKKRYKRPETGEGFDFIFVGV